MLKKIIVIVFLFLTLSTFCQEKSPIQLGIDNLPKSIYVFDFQQEQTHTYNWFSDKLNLSKFKFMIVNNDFLSENYLQINLSNIGRDISVDDIMDNYKKAKLNVFDVNKNYNHFIWNMWDIRSQNQNQPNKN